MATITTIQDTNLITSGRADINTNFANLNTDKIETSVLDTDTSLAANSDTKVATQKAVKTYVDSGGNVNASTTAKGIVEEATAAEVAAGTAAGATGARLFINPSTSLILQKTVTVTAAQVKNMKATPVTVIAGVAGQIVVIHNVLAKVVFNGDQFDGGTGGTAQLSEETSGTSLVANLLTQGQIGGAADAYQFTTPTTATARTLGTGVQIKQTGGSGNEFANGDTTVELIINYQMVTP